MNLIIMQKFSFITILLFFLAIATAFPSRTLSATVLKNDQRTFITDIISEDFKEYKRYGTGDTKEGEISKLITVSCIMPELKIGSKGNSVKFLQIILRSRYGYVGTITGVFNKATKVALVRFQKKKNLQQTGIVDKKTASVIERDAIQKWYGLECRGVTPVGRADEQRVRDIGLIQKALSLYVADMGRYPAGDEIVLGGSEATVLSKDKGFATEGFSKVYLKNIPSNPSPGGIDYIYTSRINEYSDEDCSDKEPCDWYSIKFKLEKGVLKAPLAWRSLGIYTERGAVFAGKMFPGGENIATPINRF